MTGHVYKAEVLMNMQKMQKKVVIETRQITLTSEGLFLFPTKGRGHEVLGICDVSHPNTIQ